jgi:hypothetical protein
MSASALLLTFSAAAASAASTSLIQDGNELGKIATPAATPAVLINSRLEGVMNKTFAGWDLTGGMI